ncbi:MAG: hypothetical protein H6714_03445 [Myxococcales bacterium]|nr:hypothetical protein [Myxococcales bacterium]
MPKNTIIYGILLIVLGVGSYILTQGVSATALIPAAFGLVEVGLGILGQKAGLRKHVMHIAAALGVLAILGSISGLLKVLFSFAGEALQRPHAAYSQSVMAILSIVFVALCVRSFKEARRAPRI